MSEHPRIVEAVEDEATQEILASDRSWLRRYGVISLIVVGWLAALVVIIKANDIEVEQASAADTPFHGLEERSLTALPADDPLAEANTTTSETPGLFNWESDFATERPALISKSLLERTVEQLTAVQREARRALRREERQQREARLMRPTYDFDFRDPSGRSLGTRRITAPYPWPMTPVITDSPMLLESLGRDASVRTAGSGRFVVTVDPTVFADESAMSTWVGSLLDQLRGRGIDPEIQIGRGVPSVIGRGGSDSVLGAAGGSGGGHSARAIRTTPFGGFSDTMPLPAPPADIAAAGAPPQLRPLGQDPLPIRRPGGVLTSPAPAATEPPPAASGAGEQPAPRVSTAPNSPRPRASAPAGPAVPSAPRAATPNQRRPSAIELAGSGDYPAGRALPEPEAEPAAPPAPVTLAEPTVTLHVRLSSFADRAAAERALAQLRGAGLGGSMQKTTDGLDFWVVRSRIFTKKSEADAALNRVRGMGYNAWLN